MSSDALIELKRGIDELNTWIKLIHGSEVGLHLESILDTDDKKKAFEATDGEKTVREIAEEVGISKDTVSTWWREWRKVSIVMPGHIRADRPKKIISLKDFGLL